MSESKHTPGPWSITFTIIGADKEMWPSAVVSPEKGSVDTICDFSFLTTRNIAVQQANALLIAAAPEMLEALRAIGAPDEVSMTAMSDAAIRGWAYAAANVARDTLARIEDRP